MKALLDKLLLSALLFLVSYSVVSAQASACPAVNAGLDQSICGGCTNLTATIQGTVGTTSYTNSAITYNPYSYTAGPQVLVNIDDIWTPVINIPFCFEFYGNTYTQCIIGSNGLISFNIGMASATCAWDISGPMPNSSAYDNCIMAPYHDIDPSIGATSEVHYNTYGSAPCREFVISWYHVPMYYTSCNGSLGTQQIVLHESTNIIDVYIENKPLCAAWNEGGAVEGIINLGGTQSVIVPGRNYPTQWTAANDGQRFVPAGTPNYSITWTGPSGPLGSTPTITVCPTVTTTYTATVTNSSCAGPIVVTDQVTVNINSSLTASAVSTPSACTANNGTATATPAGGSGNYSYSWSPSGGTAATATGLPPGNYTVTITDLTSGCIATQTVNVANTGGITATASSTDAICTSANGTATANPSGGSGNYSYAWAPSGGVSQTASGLSAGSYTVTVTDIGNGCTTTQTIVVNNSGGMSSTASQTDNTCASTTTGSATVTTTSGTGPFNYTWTPNVSTGTSAGNLAAGGYSVLVTDANGCTSTQSFNITAPPALTASSTQTNVTCFGGNNGSVIVTVGGGSPGYTYQWSPTISTSDTVAAIGAGGPYVVTVTDANGCSITQSVTITEPPQLTSTTTTTPVNCTTLGTATAAPSGGTGSYTYSWAPSGGTGATESGLNVGTYTVTITDANGCTATQTAAITQLATMSLGGSPTNSQCFNGNSGSATVTVTGGNGPYTYQWSPAGGNNATASGLGAGVYTCLVTDANGCTATTTYTIGQPTQISASGSSTPPTCNGGIGSATVSGVTGGTGSYTYNWSPSGGTGATANVGSGSYTCVITDANGCTITQSVNVTQPPAILATGTGNQVCPGSNATLIVAASGGTSPYTYAWNNGPTTTTQTMVATAASQGIYTVTVTDANGCTQVATAAVSLLATPTALYTTDAPASVVVLTAGAGTICFTDASTGATSWTWDFGGLGTSNLQSPCFPVTSANSGTFCTELIVQNSSGCADTTNACVEVGQSFYSIPNVFTPNTDGSNDQWIITNEGMTELRCEIYDRWGVLIYEWNGTTGNWDGMTSSGKEAVDGVYYFTAYLTDFTGKNYAEHGFFQLIR